MPERLGPVSSYPMSDFFTDDIPAKFSSDGERSIWLEKAADPANGDGVSIGQWRNSGGWGTIVGIMAYEKKLNLAVANS